MTHLGQMGFQLFQVKIPDGALGKKVDQYKYQGNNNHVADKCADKKFSFYFY